jgi:hypothetical protein
MEEGGGKNGKNNNNKAKAEQMTFDEQLGKVLSTWATNRCVCSICGSTIPKEVERVSFSYKTRYGTSYIRICGLCIIRTARKLKRKPIMDWAKKVTIKTI